MHRQPETTSQDYPALPAHHKSGYVSTIFMYSLAAEKCIHLYYSAKDPPDPSCHQKAPNLLALKLHQVAVWNLNYGPRKSSLPVLDGAEPLTSDNAA